MSCQGAVVALGPQVTAGGGIDQLRRDPHLVVSLAHAAFQHIPHAQLLAHVLYFHRFAFVGEGRVASDDEQAGDLREIGGEVLGDAVAEIVLLGIFAHVDERQHDDGGFVGQGQGCLIADCGLRTADWEKRRAARRRWLPLRRATVPSAIATRWTVLTLRKLQALHLKVCRNPLDVRAARHRPGTVRQCSSASAAPATRLSLSRASWPHLDRPCPRCRSCPAQPMLAGGTAMFTPSPNTSPSLLHDVAQMNADADVNLLGRSLSQRCEYGTGAESAGRIAQRGRRRESRPERHHQRS